MIAAAKVFMFLGAVAGVLGIVGCLILVFAWIRDRRAAHQPIIFRKSICAAISRSENCGHTPGGQQAETVLSTRTRPDTPAPKTRGARALNFNHHRLHP